MYKGLIYCFTLELIFTSCSKASPHISVACEENNVGNSIIKWETTPAIQGVVKVYASTNPDNIPEDSPVAMGNIANQRMTVITDNPMQRYYYSLVFNGRYRVKIATRNVNIPGIQNFRDLGGYPVYSAHKHVRWGMLYRSAGIDNPSPASIEELRNIGIKTLIDFRTVSESKPQEKLEKHFNIIHIPIPFSHIEDTLHGIQQGTIRSDTVHRIVERENRKLINRYAHEFRRVFDILLDGDNYPVVLHCSSGMDRTGVASALILAAIGVNDETIMEDYRLSNRYFNIPAAMRYAYRFPLRTQEAITTLYSAREGFLNAAKQEAERMHGDVDTYLRKSVGLTRKEMEKLQGILLEKK